MNVCLKTFLKWQNNSPIMDNCPLNNYYHKGCKKKYWQRWSRIKVLRTSRLDWPFSLVDLGMTEILKHPPCQGFSFSIIVYFISTIVVHGSGIINYVRSKFCNIQLSELSSFFSAVCLSEERERHPHSNWLIRRFTMLLLWSVFFSSVLSCNQRKYLTAFISVLNRLVH